MDTEDALRLAVAVARLGAYNAAMPIPGDLVVEITHGLGKPIDADAIGWLIAHDQAPYNDDDPLDGSVPMREVWDVLPLNPNAKLQTIGGERLQRWENASFAAIPPHIATAVGLICPNEVAAMREP